MPLKSGLSPWWGHHMERQAETGTRVALKVQNQALGIASASSGQWMKNKNEYSVLIAHDNQVVTWRHDVRTNLSVRHSPAVFPGVSPCNPSSYRKLVLDEATGTSQALPVGLVSSSPGVALVIDPFSHEPFRFGNAHHYFSQRNTWLWTESDPHICFRCLVCCVQWLKMVGDDNVTPRAGSRESTCTCHTSVTTLSLPRRERESVCFMCGVLLQA